MFSPERQRETGLSERLAPQLAIERIRRTPQRFQYRSRLGRPTRGSRTSTGGLSEPAVRLVGRNPAVEEIQGIEVPYGWPSLIRAQIFTFEIPSILTGYRARPQT